MFVYCLRKQQKSASYLFIDFVRFYYMQLRKKARFTQQVDAAESEDDDHNDDDVDRNDEDNNENDTTKQRKQHYRNSGINDEMLQNLFESECSGRVNNLIDPGDISNNASSMVLISTTRNHFNKFLEHIQFR